MIGRAAFNRSISHGIQRFGVYYHHGMTLHGTPSDLGSVPLGTPLEVQPDGRGLRTVTRFNRSPLADSVLEAIRNGDIRGYSFRARVLQSNPGRLPRQRAGAPPPTVTRTELGLIEYGPTPTPAYEEAGIMAVRSAQDIAQELAGLDEDRLADLIRALSPATPLDPEATTATPESSGPGAEDSPAAGHSGRLAIRRAALRAEMIRKGVMRRDEAA